MTIWSTTQKSFHHIRHVYFHNLRKICSLQTSVKQGMKYQGVKNFTLVARLTREPHVSCTWGAPLHHWLNATWWGHYLCTWATRELYVSHTVSCTWGTPLHRWLNATREGITMHMSHTWAVCEGLPSTIDWMLHVWALPCMWATRELYVRGSPPPLIECYTWGHYRAREPHVSSHTWGAPLHHWLNATHEGITVHVSHTWATHEPHMSCMWGAPIHHWLNATCEGITVHLSHTWAVHEPHVSCTWGAPLHHWLNATREGITVHVSHTCELYVRGSPPPLIECYTWGHNCARESL